MFQETVTVDGAAMPRFSLVAPDRADGSVAAELIAGLGLTRHPEGGWYRETYRATGTIPGALFPERAAGERSFSTAIYFLLERGDLSAFHRIKSDELWHFHAGAPLIVHLITPEGAHRFLTLGNDPAAGESFQGVVPAGCWFGAETTGAFSLVGCTVAPGFDFADFEMGSRSDLLSRFPVHAGIITRLTRNGE
jgi:predicted cupin superfamily sugar epimerase